MRASIVLLAALVAAGCESDLSRRSELDGLRVLALLADPLELAPTDSVTLSPVVFSDTAVTHSWHFCPIHTGARGGYTCAIPECDFELTPDSAGRVTAQPALLALRCIESIDTQGAQDQSGVPGELPELVEVVFRYVATTADDRREAVARLTLHTMAPPETPNRPPVIDEVRIAGALTSTTSAITFGSLDDVPIDVTIDATSLDEGEAPLVSFYSTAGELDDDRQAGTEVSTTLLAPDAEELTIYVVARDGRGGQAVAGPFTVRKQ